MSNINIKAYLIQQYQKGGQNLGAQVNLRIILIR